MNSCVKAWLVSMCLIAAASMLPTAHAWTEGRYEIAESGVRTAGLNRSLEAFAYWALQLQLGPKGSHESGEETLSVRLFAPSSNAAHNESLEPAKSVGLEIVYLYDMRSFESSQASVESSGRNASTLLLRERTFVQVPIRIDLEELVEYRDVDGDGFSSTDDVVARIHLGDVEFSRPRMLAEASSAAESSSTPPLLAAEIQGTHGFSLRVEGAQNQPTATSISVRLEIEISGYRPASDDTTLVLVSNAAVISEATEFSREGRRDGFWNVENGTFGDVRPFLSFDKGGQPSDVLVDSKSSRNTKLHMTLERAGPSTLASHVVAGVTLSDAHQATAGDTTGYGPMSPVIGPLFVLFATLCTCLLLRWRWRA